MVQHLQENTGWSSLQSKRKQHETTYTLRTRRNQHVPKHITFKLALDSPVSCFFENFLRWSTAGRLRHLEHGPPTVVSPPQTPAPNNRRVELRNWKFAPYDRSTWQGFNKCSSRLDPSCRISSTCYVCSTGVPHADWALVKSCETRFHTHRPHHPSLDSNCDMIRRLISNYHTSRTGTHTSSWRIEIYAKPFTCHLLLMFVLVALFLCKESCKVVDPSKSRILVHPPNELFPPDKLQNRSFEPPADLLSLAMILIPYFL